MSLAWRSPTAAPLRTAPPSEGLCGADDRFAKIQFGQVGADRADIADSQNDQSIWIQVTLGNAHHILGRHARSTPGTNSVK